MKRAAFLLLLVIFMVGCAPVYKPNDLEISDPSVIVTYLYSQRSISVYRVYDCGAEVPTQCIVTLTTYPNTSISCIPLPEVNEVCR